MKSFYVVAFNFESDCTEMAPDYNLCKSCFEKFGHSHDMKKSGVDREGKTLGYSLEKSDSLRETIL